MENRTTLEDVNRILEKFCNDAGLPFAERSNMSSSEIEEGKLDGALYVEKIWGTRYYNIRQYPSNDIFFNNMSGDTLKGLYDRIFVARTTLEFVKCGKFPALMK